MFNSLISFNYPGWLVILLFMPAIFFYFTAIGHRGLGQLRFPFKSWNSRGFLPQQRFLRLCIIISRISFYTALILFVISLAGPVRLKQKSIYYSAGSSIAIVMDVSPSMEAFDSLYQTRFENMKSMVKSFISERGNDEIALVGFGSEATLLAPATTNIDHLLESIDKLETGFLGLDTAIGSGLATALLHLNNIDSTDKFVLLFTDGGQNSGTIHPDIAVRMLRELGIRLYTIALDKIYSGAELQASQDTDLCLTQEIVIQDPDSGQFYKGCLPIDSGSAELEQLVISNGGFFARASSRIELKKILNNIDHKERVQRSIGTKVEEIPLRDLIIRLALILILFSFVIRKLFLREIL